MEDKIELFDSIGFKADDIINFVYHNEQNFDHDDGSQMRDTMGFDVNVQHLNYNIVMLACQYGAFKILEYLYEKVVVPSKNPV